MRQTCSFIVGEVGDTATVYVNDVPLYPVSEPGFGYTKNIALNVPLPPALLSQTVNEIKVRAHSVKIEQSGLAHGPVAITSGLSGTIYAHWKTFRTIFLPLICATIAAATALLVSSLTVGARKSQDVDAFIRYATVAALFMLSFSEIPRMLLPVSIAIPAHFLLRFGADWAAFAWLLRFTEAPQGIQRWGNRFYALAAGAVTFVWGLGILSAAGFRAGDPASFVYQVVFVFYAPLLTLPLLAALSHARHRDWARAALVGGVVLITAHEGLVGFGYLDHEFLSKYHHAVIVFTYALLVARRTGREQEADRSQAEIAARVSSLSQQMAHDIRSPLAALEVASDDLVRPSEQTRVLMRTAIVRIQDIANELLRTSRVNAPQPAGGEARTVLLACALQEVVSEKRVEFRNQLSLVLDMSSQSAAWGLFVHAEVATLKRIISNLLNNSIEASNGPEERRVRVELLKRPGAAEILIQDKGKGMSPETLAKLGTRGFSTGKAAGHGLGVASSHESLKQWGGELTYTSVLGQGTTARVMLPLAKPPAWFAPAIDLSGVRRIIILDDDQSIHEVWKDRFSQLQQLQAEVVHLANPAHLAESLHGYPPAQLLCLIDFEYLGSPMNGLDVIEANGIAARAHLVTSRYDEERVVQRCLALGVRIIPKLVAGHLPISLERVKPNPVGQPPDVVLIDDDPLVASTWALQAGREGKHLAVYQDADSFWSEAASIPAFTPIFVDYELAHGARGDVLSKNISEAGFTRLFLATGHVALAQKTMPWIEGVVGKEPPF